MAENGDHIPEEFNPVEKNLLMSFFLNPTNNLFTKEDKLKKIVDSAIKETGAHVVKEIVHKFEPTGESGVYVLAESDATYHTSPQYNFWSFSISTCGQTHPFRAIQLILTQVDPEAGVIKYFKSGMDLKNTSQVFPNNLDYLIKRYKEQFEELTKTYSILGRELEPQDFKFVFCKPGANQTIQDYLAKSHPLHLYANIKTIMDYKSNKNGSSFFK